MKTTDEKLSAFLDGELPAGEIEEIEAAIAKDPSLAARVSELRGVDEVLASALAGIENEPIPDSIMQMISQHADEKASNVVELNATARRRWYQTPLPMAAAACIGLLVGSIFATEQNQPEYSEQIFAGSVGINTSLHKALETQPSDAKAGKLTPVLTYTTADGEVCREILSSESRALACRNDAQWTVLAVTYEPQIDHGSNYVTASSDAAIVFDLLAEELQFSAPMTSDEEAVLIEHCWNVQTDNNN